MKDWYDILRDIKNKPTLYLSRRSIFDLHSFYLGYCAARRSLDLPMTDQEQEFQFFSDWLHEKYNMKERRSWAMIVLFYSYDERNALDNFFELFEEFINRE